MTAITQHISNTHLPSAAICFPVIAAFFAAVSPIRNATYLKMYFYSATTLILVLFLFPEVMPFNAYFSSDALSVKEWIPLLGASFLLANDGLSSLFVVLSILISFFIMHENGKSFQPVKKSFVVLLLLFVASSAGIFLSNDLLLFLFMFGASAPIVYLMMHSTGDYRKRMFSIRFMIYQFISFLCVLFGVLIIYYSFGASSGNFTFDLMKIQQIGIPIQHQKWAFAALVIGFLIRSPMFPFHGWLTDTFSETPYSISMLLSGIFDKIGFFALIKLCLPLCPDMALEYSWAMILLAFISLIYGGFISLVQPDIFKFLGFADVSFNGFILLGIFSLNKNGLHGAVFLIVAHSLVSCMLLSIFGRLSSKAGTQLIMDLEGLGRINPQLTFLILMLFFCLWGLPGGITFPGIFMIIAGVLAFHPIWAIIALAGIILSSSSFIWLFHRLHIHPQSPLMEHCDSKFEYSGKAILIIPIICIFLIGIQPHFLMTIINESVKNIETTINNRKMLHASPKHESKRSYSKSLSAPQSPDFQIE